MNTLHLEKFALTTAGLHGYLTSFDNLCKKGAKPGYVLDCATVIHNEAVSEAAEKVYHHIQNCIDRLQESGRVVNLLYVGTTQIHSKKGVTFDASNYNTWNLDRILNRYKHLCDKQEYEVCLTVVAVVTNESIPDDCRREGGYVSKLERILLNKFMQQNDKGLANKTIAPGIGSIAPGIGYAIYLAFAMRGKFNFPPIKYTMLYKELVGHTLR